jgi:hypothetical protein
MNLHHSREVIKYCASRIIRAARPRGVDGYGAGQPPSTTAWVRRRHASFPITHNAILAEDMARDIIEEGPFALGAQLLGGEVAILAMRRTGEAAVSRLGRKPI